MLDEKKNLVADLLDTLKREKSVRSSGAVFISGTPSAEQDELANSMHLHLLPSDPSKLTAEDIKTLDEQIGKIDVLKLDGIHLKPFSDDAAAGK